MGHDGNGDDDDDDDGDGDAAGDGWLAWTERMVYGEHREREWNIGVGM